MDSKITVIEARTIRAPLDNPTSFATRDVVARDYGIVRARTSDGLEGIGFCYGGKVVLDLARSGANLQAVATFHAILAAREPAQEGKVQAEILVLHGELDSMVTLDDVASFREEMHAAQVEHDVIVFEDAKHGFSNPLADERAKANGVDLGYSPIAEQQSLDAMYQLLQRRLA